MPRRIDIELTSDRQDGSWTWRAAGAKLPKGTLDAAVLYGGAQVGDVVRAEADFGIDGITILTVIAPQAAPAEKVERLEITGTRQHEGGVTSSLVPKSDRPRGPRREGDRDRGDRPRRDDRGPRDQRGDRSGPRREGERSGAREGGGRTDRGPRQPREAREGAGRGDRGDRAPRPEQRGRPAAAEAPKAKRLSPGNKHRQAMLDALAPEQHVVAEQLIKGGIPALRQAIDAMNAEAKAAGNAEVNPGPLLQLAEEMLPKIKSADWRDKADAALPIVDEISIRDLRGVVAGADAGARDDEARLIAAQLREALDRRVNEQRDSWLADLTQALEDDRLVRALRLASRPPDPGARVPNEVSDKLAEAASAALNAEVANDRWLTVLEAVADSPVRRSVKPAGLPATADEHLKQVAAQNSGRVPALAAMLGVSMPPPPGPARKAPPPRPSAPPPPPPAPPAPVVEAAPAPAAEEAAPPPEPDTVAGYPAEAPDEPTPIPSDEGAPEAVPGAESVAGYPAEAPSEER